MRQTCEIATRTHTPKNTTKCAHKHDTENAPKPLKPFLSNAEIDMGCGLTLTQGVLTLICVKGGVWANSLGYALK